MRHCKVLVADKSEVFVMGLKEVLRPYLEHFTIKDLKEPSWLNKWLETERPNVLVSEIEFLDGLSDVFLKRIKAVFPELKILVLTDKVSDPLIKQAIRNGVDGYIKKDRPATDILEALRSLMLGNKYFSPEVSSLFFQTITEAGHELSERELEILRYICKGRSNEQIADLLSLSEKTVATHKKNIMRKAKVKKTPDLILWALNLKVVSI